MTRRWLLGVGALGLLTAQAAVAQTEGEQTVTESETTIEEDLPQACRAGGQVLEFATDSDQLSKKDREALDAVARWAEANDQRAVRLEGFTDRSGPSSYNEQLSERRAESARSHLVAQGVSADKVVAIGRGEVPVAMGITPQQRSVIVLYCEGEPMTTSAEETTPSAEEEAAAAAAAAAAEPTPEPVLEPMPAEPPVQPTEVTTAAPEQVPTWQKIGFGLSVGGGGFGFVDQEARDIAGIGGDWDARFIVGTRLPVAFEAAYVGSAQPLDAAGINPDAILIGQGAEGALRVQLPTFYVRPYALAGLGWTRYYVSQSDGVRGLLEQNDDVMTVPLSLGITFRAPLGATFDIRGTYRPTYFEDLMDGYYVGTGKTADLTSWSANARLGFEF